ncbi:jg22143 [Pararge aegeria aegeria]|uniref:Jg22143 protein n=1 Tax=Pararge aegeria aegeria TaxID=348720 RepID=A0A8S4RTL4_9NEOP|nr:jg22143 [Pararge aegeria aegeria]
MENDHLKNDVRSLQDRVTVTEDQVIEMHSNLSRQQQQARMNNLEIVGLPQTSNESPSDLILRVAKYAGVELKLDDIDFAHRVQPQKPIAGRPKPIVVKLKDRLCKDRLLSGLKSKKGICTRDIGIEGPEKKFFVNEHLTPVNKQLLRQLNSWQHKKPINMSGLETAAFFYGKMKNRRLYAYVWKKTWSC